MLVLLLGPPPVDIGAELDPRVPPLVRNLSDGQNIFFTMLKLSLKPSWGELANRGLSSRLLPDLSLLIRPSSLLLSH